MKIANTPGEFFFRALYLDPSDCWKLSISYFSTIEDAIVQLGKKVKWPVEILDNGAVYVPAPDEYASETPQDSI